MCSPRSAPVLVTVLAMCLGLCVGLIQDEEYCSLCGNHTMCVYKGLGASCLSGSRGGPLTAAERREVLVAHNRLRGRVALGQEGAGAPGPLPPAQDMQELVWDEELARTAQRWADQCDFSHDACRSDPRFMVGQNLFLSEGGVPWEQAVLSWYSELEFFDNKYIKYFINDEATDHFSQVIWGNTRYIGCGKRTYPQKPKGRLYKREAAPLPEEDREAEAVAGVRQPRKIDDGKYRWRSPGASGNKEGNWKSSAGNGIKENSWGSQEVSGNKDNSWQHKQNANKPNTVFDSSFTQTSAWQAYNRSIQQYLEQNSGQLQLTQEVQQQIQEYREYLQLMKIMAQGGLSYSQQQTLYSRLSELYTGFQQQHELSLQRQRDLQRRVSLKRPLRPHVQSGYSFSTQRPVTAGQEYEYYVCNYGPAGNIPGARAYSPGETSCTHGPEGGLCHDPLERGFYPGIEDGDYGY